MKYFKYSKEKYSIDYQLFTHGTCEILAIIMNNRLFYSYVL